MERSQKIKVLDLVSQGIPIKQAVEVALMPEIMFVIGCEKAEQIKATGYNGIVIILEDEYDLEA